MRMSERPEAGNRLRWCKPCLAVAQSISALIRDLGDDQ
jgi:hypothetical protein